MSAMREVPLELVERAYESAVSPDLWPRFLEQLAPLLNAATLHLVVSFSDRGERGVAYSYGAKPEFERSFVERFLDAEPWREPAASLPEGTVSAGIPAFSQSDLERTAFYREWMEPQDLLHPAGAILHKPGGELRSVLTCFRRRSDEPFDGDDLALLRSIVPHLQRVLGIQRALRTVEMVRDAALQTLDRMSEGWIVLGSDASVLATNRSAQRILERGDTLRLEGGRLATTESAPTERLRQLLARATDSRGEAAGGEIELTSRSGEALRAVSSPLRAGEHGARSGLSAAVLFVGAPDHGSEQSPHRLRESYGLTHAEARVAGRLAEGQRLSEIARDLGISINTVRGHLKQVFAKTGTHRQAELVRLVLSGPSQIAG